MQEPLSMPVAPAVRDYVDALHEHGLLTGEPGARQIPDATEEVLGALHAILAGGTANIMIEDEGARSVKDTLDGLLRAALEDHNGFPDNQVFF